MLVLRLSCELIFSAKSAQEFAPPMCCHTGAPLEEFISKIFSLAAFLNNFASSLAKTVFEESNMLCAVNNSVRLACLKHAASVRPEPGSNSNVIYLFVYL